MKPLRGITRSAWLWLALAACLASSSTGCTRAFYRRQADAQAYDLIRQKANHPHWPLENYSIEIDPGSRLFDPFTPDRPPMPPDDPTAHRLMHNIDDFRGFPRWHKSGDTPYVENPEWISYLPLGDDGALELDADRVVLVARLHSTGYQRNLEELYLSALDVSFERFRFDAQFFAGYSVEYIADGPLRNFGNGSDRAAAGAAGLGESRSQLTATTVPIVRSLGLSDAVGGRGIQVRKLGTTGTEFVANLANSIVWQFSGPNTNVTNTIIDFTLFQPLLRRGGRDRVLERLTIAERSLLANVRQMEHYRRGFYLQVVTGRDAGQGPSRRGGVFGGSGLEGFSGVGGGGFGQVGNATGGGGGAGAAGVATTAAGAAQAGGFIGLLQRQQDIRNQEANVAALRSSLASFTDFSQANRIDFLQVQQSRLALFNSQSRLLNTQNDYQNALDQYKIQIGLPPQLEVRIADDLLDLFNLIDSTIVPTQNRLTDLQLEVGRTIVEILPPAPQDEAAEAPEPELKWSLELEARLRKLKSQLAQAQEIRKQLRANNVPRAEADIERLIAALPKRREDLVRLQERIKDTDTDPEAAAILVDFDRLEKLPQRLKQGLAEATKRLDDFEASLNAFDANLDDLLAKGETLEPKELLKQLRTKVFALIPNELTEMSANVLELSLVQARARTDTVSLTPIDMRPEAAFEIARNYRRDWMNARASLVDTWRLVEFNADDLESSLDVVFSGDIANVGNNPVALRGAAGRLRVGLQFDAPITRLSERNVYRQSLIEYQQARRSFYTVGDQIARGLRSSLRTVELNQLNFELRRASIQVAVEQVELARLRLQEPPAVAAVAARLGATTARDLVSALTDLQNAQNDFLSVWVNYEVLRRTLDQDMGTMRLDEQGLWVDPGPIGLRYGYPDLSDAENIPPDVFLPSEEISPIPAEGIETPEPSRDRSNRRPPGAGPLPQPLPDEEEITDKTAAATKRATTSSRIKPLLPHPATQRADEDPPVEVATFVDSKPAKPAGSAKSRLFDLPPLRKR